ncbi:MAG: cell division protein FtsQ/DivIB [Vicingaceae bacterium]
MNKWLKIGGWTLSIVLIGVVFGFVNKSNHETVFEKPLINIDYETENRFINVEDVQNQILTSADSGALRLANFNVNYIEEKLNNDPSIKEAQVYKTVNGKLIVNVKQRRPIVRIFPKNGMGYYIDEKANLMPLSNKYAARLLVVSGEVNEPFAKRYKFNYNNLRDSLADKTILDDIYKLANFIDKSEFWKAQIEQIAVNKVSEFELIPKVGNHKIVFGEIRNLEGKFEKLMIFYKKGLGKTGWNEYSEINLKYKNQVVCKKRNS